MGKFLELLTIEAACFLVSIKEHRAFRVDAEGKLLVGGIGYAGPTQILCNATCIAPPVCQTELHQQLIATRFGNDVIEMDQSLFIPFAGRPTQRMRSRPVGQIGDRPDVSWPTLTRRPYPHNSNARLRRLTQGLWHAKTILIAVHH